MEHLCDFLLYVITHFGALCGLLLLIAVIYAAVTEIVKAFKPERRVEAYRIGERWTLTIRGATRADIVDAIKIVRERDPKGVINIYERDDREGRDV